MGLRKALLLGLLAAVVVLGLAGPFVWGLVGPIDLAELKNRYALPNSQFLEVDGVPVHTAEDGPKDKPCLVLLTGMTLNLRTWDAIVPLLASHFRILRIDLLTQGLTGPDAAGGDTLARDFAIVDAVTRQAGAERFALIGASDGGMVAYAYAAAHPDRVDRLILIGATGLPGVADLYQPEHGWIMAWISTWIDDHIKLRIGVSNFIDDSAGVHTPNRDFIQMIYEMGRRADLDPEIRRDAPMFRVDDPAATLAKVRAPTLLMWGESDPISPHTNAEVFAYWLTAAPTLIRTYPHVGHYPAAEIPDAVAAEVTAFLTGASDTALRRTERVAP